MSALNAKDLLRRARIQLLVKQPFWGYLASYLDLREMPLSMRKIARGPVGTDGRAIYYDPEEVVKIPPEQHEGMVCHEVCHDAFRHIWRRGTRNPKGWNIATDSGRADTPRRIWRLTPS